MICAGATRKPEIARGPHQVVLRLARVVSALGNIVRVWSVTLLVPVIVAMIYEPRSVSVLGFMFAPNALLFGAWAVLVFALGTMVVLATKNVADDDLQDREAYMTVGLGWIVLAVLASVPFSATTVLPHPADAFFEAMSGLTTTGATVISTNLNDVAPSILAWRGVLQYIGGMGIVVLGVALLSRLTHGGIQMLQAESPGPTMTRLRPRLEQTAKTLWGIYLIISAVLFVVLSVVLMAKGFEPSDAILDAMLHTLTTVSTGGFSEHSSSISHHASLLIEIIIVGFMLLCGTNFSLIYYASRGNFRPLFTDPEWRFYIGTYVTVTLAITGILWQAGQAAGTAMRGAMFTVGTFITSTGFTTVDYDQWPDVAKILLLIVMMTGGTAGSTSGGMKHIRILLLIKLVRHEIRQLIHPKAVLPLKLAGQSIRPQTAYAVVAFFFTYVALWLVGTLLLAAFDPVLGPVDAAGASVSALSNMGPAFGVVGPTKHFGMLSDFSKVLLSLEMWIGRLEVFTVLLLLSRDTWRN